MVLQFRFLAGALCIGLLAACGGGGGPPAAAPPLQAPAGLSYPAPPAFTRGMPIAQLAPTVTGAVTLYTVAPPLPPGLQIEATTGTLSGTPTAIAATASHVITASNASGSATATVALTVNEIVPDISYAAATQSLTSGVPVTLAPTQRGGAVTQWSVDGALPAGLALDPATGVISGTPTQAGAARPYVLSARNSGGTGTFTMSIGVHSGVLIDLGHAAAIQDLRFDGSRIASLDGDGHMALWNAQTGAKIVGSDGACGSECGERIALAGATAVFRRPTGLEVRAAADGAPIATIDLPASAQTWWVLAADGSYIGTGSATALTVYAPNGTVLFTRSGHYAGAKPFAAAGELRVAAGAAGADLIEIISLPGGTTTLTRPFQGTFHSWFVDGGRFLSHVGNTVWVYSRDAVQHDLVALAALGGLAGQGDWYWASDSGSQRIYRVGAGSTPAASYANRWTRAMGSGGVLALVAFDRLGIVDFSTGTPVMTEYGARSSAFAARSPSEWVFGNGVGEVLGSLAGPGATKRYAFGAAYSIAASDTRIVVATQAGSVLQFDAATRSLLSELRSAPCVENGNAPVGTKVAMSADGRRLMTGPAEMFGCRPHPLRLYDLPAETVAAEWPFAGAQPRLLDWTLSLSGTLIGQITTENGFTRKLLRLDGTLVWSDTAVFDDWHALDILAIHLSPDGSLIAVSSGYSGLGERSPSTVTQIYRGATLAHAVPGAAVGWVDGNRLLVNRYVSAKLGSTYERCEFVTADAQVTACPAALPEIRRILPVTSNSLYAPKLNAIYDLTTGAALWTSAAPGRALGAIAGPLVVFASGTTIRAEPR